MPEQDDSSPWNVLVIEDDAMLGSLLGRAIEREADLRIVGIAQTLSEAEKIAAGSPPAIVLLDLNLGRGPGAESGWTLLERWPSTLPAPRWIVLTGQPETAHLRRALDLGLSGYVTKREPFETLLAALREVRAGRQYYSVGALRLLMEQPAAAPGLEQLTPRERDVLRAAGDGLGVRETATRLGLSENTVKTHRKHLMAKLGLHDSLAVTRYALAAGLSVNQG